MEEEVNTPHSKHQLQQSLTNLLGLIIQPFLSTTTTSIPLDQSQLQQHSLAFSIQLHQTIIQLIQTHHQQQQQQQQKQLNQQQKEQQQRKEEQQQQQQKEEQQQQQQQQQEEQTTEEQKEEEQKEEEHKEEEQTKEEQEKEKQAQKKGEQKKEEQQQQQQQQEKLKQHQNQQPEKLHINHTQSLISPSLSIFHHSIQRAQSEPNHPSHPIDSKPTKCSTTSPREYHLDSSSSSSLPQPPILSILSPHPDQTISCNQHLPSCNIVSDSPKFNLKNTKPDQDFISEHFRLYIQSEIEDGFNDLVTQFDESLQDAKHQLVSINRSLLESKLVKKKDLGPDQTLAVLPRPLSKIQVGSLGEKLKLQFESHLIDSYKTYLNRFSHAIGYTGLGETSLDLNDDQQNQILNPGPQSNTNLADQPNQPVVSDPNLDQKLDQIFTEKIENYRTGFQKQAKQFRNEIQSSLKHHIETGSNELNETIDQIEKILVREKEELKKFQKQIDAIAGRINQLETQFGNETNPIVRRANVLKSLGLIQSDHDAQKLQKLNLNIFLTKLNHHLRINLSQILINNLDSDQSFHPTDSSDRPRYHQSPDASQVDLQGPNMSDLIPKGENPLRPEHHQQQVSNSDEEFVDKFIIKLIMRINQTLSFYDDRQNHESLYQAIPDDHPNNPEQDSNLHQDYKHNNPNQQGQDQKVEKEVRDHHDIDHNQSRPKVEIDLHPHELSHLDHQHPHLMADNIKDIHLVLSQFFDLNFKKFVWPKFQSLVYQLEAYILRMGECAYARPKYHHKREI